MFVLHIQINSELYAEQCIIIVWANIITMSSTILNESKWFELKII